MSAARTSTIPEGSTMIPSAGPPWRHRVCKATAARGRRIEGSCRGRGPETPDGIALRVCLQPRLPVREADLAVRFAPPLQVVEGL